MKTYRLALPPIAALLAAACAAAPSPQAPTAPGAVPMGPDAAIVVPESEVSRLEDEVRSYRLMAVDDLTVVSVAVDSQGSNTKVNMIDGKGGTAWGSGVYRAPSAWAQLQVGGDAVFTALGIKTGAMAAGSSYDIQVSGDGQTWTTVLANQRNDSWYLETKTFPAPVTGKFLRVFWRNSTTAPEPKFAIYEVIPHGSFDGGTGPTPAPTGTPTAMPSGSPSTLPSIVPSVMPSGAFSQYYPDLHPIPTRNFYVVSSGPKRILRFPAALGNVGPGHLRVRGTPTQDGYDTDGYQEILDAQNRVVQRQFVGRFFWHAEHNHIHLTDVARYELRGEGPTGPVLRRATKVSFCLEDSFKIQAGNQAALHPDCKNPLMGITKTWCDYYNAGLPGQEFDISGLSAGYYYVLLRLDPTQKFLQTRRDNDMVWTRIYLDPAAGRTYPVGYSEGE